MVEGFGVDEPGSAADAWVTVDLAPERDGSFGSSEAGGRCRGGQVVLRRPAFVLDSLAPVHRAARITVLGAVILEIYLAFDNGDHESLSRGLNGAELTVSTMLPPALRPLPRTFPRCVDGGAPARRRVRGGRRGPGPDAEDSPDASPIVTGARRRESSAVIERWRRSSRPSSIPTRACR